jgi:hypothetical protein
MADTPPPDPADNQPPGYVPPKVWTWDKASGGQFANIRQRLAIRYQGGATLATGPVDHGWKAEIRLPRNG